MSLSWIAWVWGSGLFHSHCIEPEKDCQAADRGWIEDTLSGFVMTQGEVSIVVENAQKGGENNVKTKKTDT